MTNDNAADGSRTIQNPAQIDIFTAPPPVAAALARRESRAPDMAAIRSASDAAGEAYDCTVVAVAAVSGRPYSESRAEMRRQGRKNRKGATVTKYRRALESFGLEMIDVTDDWPQRTALTLSRAMTRSTGRYIVRTTRHVAAVIDGVTDDWSATGRKRVTNVWKIQPLRSTQQ